MCLLGVHFGLFLILKSLLCSSRLMLVCYCFPWSELSVRQKDRRKNSWMSKFNSFWLYFFGVGTKFKFLFKSGLGKWVLRSVYGLSWKVRSISNCVFNCVFSFYMFAYFRFLWRFNNQSLQTLCTRKIMKLLENISKIKWFQFIIASCKALVLIIFTFLVRTK